jgi:hypothetical protein
MSQHSPATKPDLSAVAPAKADPHPEWLRVVRQKVETLRYGVVQLVLHDGRVTQIERTEKTRIVPSPHGPASASP